MCPCRRSHSFHCSLPFSLLSISACLLIPIQSKRKDLRFPINFTPFQHNYTSCLFFVLHFMLDYNPKHMYMHTLLLVCTHPYYYVDYNYTHHKKLRKNYTIFFALVQLLRLVVLCRSMCARARFIIIAVTFSELLRVKINRTEMIPPVKFLSRIKLRLKDQQRHCVMECLISVSTQADNKLLLFFGRRSMGCDHCILNYICASSIIATRHCTCYNMYFGCQSKWEKRA